MKNQGEHHGDRQARSLAHNGGTSPCNSYTYRASGEIATKTEVDTDRVTQYTYDEVGALQRVVLPDGRVIDYELDPLGRRIGKRVGGPPS